MAEHDPPSEPLLIRLDIEQIIQGVRSQVPTVRVEQLPKTHPGDDDGLWYFGLPGLDLKQEIQVESWTRNCPFIVEYGEEQLTVNTVDEAVQVITSYLKRLEGRPR